MKPPGETCALGSCIRDHQGGDEDDDQLISAMIRSTCICKQDHQDRGCRGLSINYIITDEAVGVSPNDYSIIMITYGWQMITMLHGSGSSTQGI